MSDPLDAAAGFPNAIVAVFVECLRVSLRLRLIHSHYRNSRGAFASVLSHRHLALHPFARHAKWVYLVIFLYLHGRPADARARGEDPFEG